MCRIPECHIEAERDTDIDDILSVISCCNVPQRGHWQGTKVK